jgi:hypothetical protein
MPSDEVRVINSKLKTLKKAFDRNEELMQQAAINYENLVAQKESLQVTMEDLRKTRAELRQKKNVSD